MDVIEHKAKWMLKSTAEQESKKGLSVTVYLRAYHSLKVDSSFFLANNAIPALPSS